MSPSRREFLKQLGIALASLVATRCVPPLRRSTPTPEVLCYEMPAPTTTPEPTPRVTCYTVVPLPTGTPLPAAAAELTRQTEALKATTEAGGLPPDATRQAMAALARERLRACWLGLDLLAEQSADLDQGEAMLEGLVDEHRAALNDLVAAGELDEEVAAQVQFAFGEAAYHVWRSSAPITCYEMAPGEVEPRADLVQRAEALAEVSSGLDADAVEQARQALMRDIAFLHLLQSGQVQGIVLAEMWAAGGFEASEMDVAAAQFLVDLLLEE